MFRIPRLRLLAALLGVAVIAAGALLLAPDSAPQAESGGHGPVFVHDGYAIRGYDPVAYFTEGEPVAGRAEFEAEWNGATWRFASAGNRERFVADPEAYAPQYGGFCAWAVAEKGELYSIDPHAWKIVDGKLYLNFSDSIQRRWERDIPGFIELGDRRWPEIVEES